MIGHNPSMNTNQNYTNTNDYLTKSKSNLKNEPSTKNSDLQQTTYKVMDKVIYK